jgi:hypothetical protein
MQPSYRGGPAFDQLAGVAPFPSLPEASPEV